MTQPPTTTTTGTGGGGATFRAMRRGAGLSVRKLAQQSEVSHGTISRWERGERVISEATYEHLTLTLASYMAGKWAA